MGFAPGPRPSAGKKLSRLLENYQIRFALYDGGTMVQVAASHVTSSKLCKTLKPIADKLSKFPSPSIYPPVSSCSDDIRGRDRNSRYPRHTRSTLVALFAVSPVILNPEAMSNIPQRM